MVPYDFFIGLDKLTFSVYPVNPCFDEVREAPQAVGNQHLLVVFFLEYVDNHLYWEPVADVESLDPA